MRPCGRILRPFRPLQLKLPTFHLSQNDASNAMSRNVRAQFSKFPPVAGRLSAKRAGFLLRAFICGWGSLPSYAYCRAAGKSHAACAIAALGWFQHSLAHFAKISRGLRNCSIGVVPTLLRPLRENLTRPAQLQHGAGLCRNRRGIAAFRLPDL